mmetsp:Transcript_82705/g.258234  ORF Transcript_82705/g.258234 Transcript_82705/m.258234 type:complete len:238 (-) Transcript_82705:11-724(-)
MSGSTETGGWKARVKEKALLEKEKENARAASAKASKDDGAKGRKNRSADADLIVIGSSESRSSSSSSSSRKRRRRSRKRHRRRRSSSRSSSSSGQTAEAMRTLRLRALPGRRWPEFNATDFSTTRLLKVAATTQARPLAAAVGSEVRRLGAASVHAFMDDKVAVSTALKALALVPQEHGGQRVFFVPSFGHVKRGSTLRLHVQPLARRSTLPPAAAEGSALGPEPGPTGGAVEGELD